MVLRSGSGPTTHGSFQAELEGVVLHHTAAVDIYLSTAAPKWTAASAGDHATPAALQSLFQADMSSAFWQSSPMQEPTLPAPAVHMVGEWASGTNSYQQVSAQLMRHATRRPRTCSHQGGTESRLQRYLEQQAVTVQEQFGRGALEASTAVSGADSYAQGSSNSSSDLLMQLPYSVQSLTVCAPEVADAAGSPCVDSAVSPQTGSLAQDTDDTLHLGQHSMGTSAAGKQQVASNSSGVSVASPAAATSTSAAEPSRAAAAFCAEDDDDIAAQKQAARARLAELQGQELPALEDDTKSSVHGKAAAGKVEAVGGASYSSVHSLGVPKRPLGFAGMSSKAFATSSCMDVLVDPSVFGPTALGQHCRYTNMMKWGLIFCVVLLAVSLGLQECGAGGALLQWCTGQKVQSLISHIYVPLIASLLLLALVMAWVTQPPLLHFASPSLESQYLAWSNTGKLLVDCMFQVLFLVVGSCLWLMLRYTELDKPEHSAAPASAVLALMSVVFSGLPVLSMMLLRSKQYLQWREQLLTGSRLCSVAALALMQSYSTFSDLTQLPLGVSFVALAQLMGLACMQVRLATFVPCQVAHLLVLLFKTRVSQPALHFAQLVGGGLCLPCLLLHSLELYSRKAFLATITSPSGKLKQA